MPNIDGVKTHQGREQAPVCLGDLITNQIALLGENAFKPIECLEQLGNFLFVNILTGRKARLVHPIVDLVVHTLVDSINLRHQC